jgi:excinuclease ABC subunit A
MVFLLFLCKYCTVFVTISKYKRHFVNKTKKLSNYFSKKDDIFIKGARIHNLKNVSLVIPRGKLVVITGVSGSGKSSLTIDTLYAEGQRRYAESLSAYARQFMQRMDKPDVDYIKGLCPAIAIEQKVVTRTPRSTVGSMTEIYDYLRLLFARVGKTISPISGTQVKKDDVADVLHHIQTSPIGERVLLLVKLKVHKNRNINEELKILLQKGFTRIYVNDETIDIQGFLEDKKTLTTKQLTNSYVLIDRIITKEFDEEDLHRMSDSIDLAFYEGEGELYVYTIGKKTINFNNRFEADGILFEEPVPNLFSFNNPYGACPTCEGFSQVLGLDADLIIPNKLLSVYEEAVAPWKGEKLSWWKNQLIKGAAAENFPIHKPIADLTDAQYKVLWNGCKSFHGIKAFFKEVEENLYKIQYRVLLSRYRGKTLCSDCNGYRLRKEALYVKVGEKHIGELCEMPVKDLQQWFDKLKLSDYDKDVAKRVLIEIHQRLETLVDVGLGYLTLNRLANSLSGGESQRIQITRSIGSNLTDSLYILDEPSIGLHSRDTTQLIKVLKNLQKLGNTVVVVEHDEMIMQEADHIVDMGPLASHLGGEVIAEGDYKAILKNKKSLTGQYLSGALTIETPEKVRTWKKSITVKGARQNNLKNIDVTFPLEAMTVVTGVSGSGKTTLIKQLLYPALQKLKGEYGDKVGLYKSIEGDVEAITQIEMIDQNPIGKSSRSNPVTYIKAYDAIRDLFAQQPLSKISGFLPKHFSFNVDGGRCDTCKGDGEQVVEMQFLADVHLTCESCKGKRFKDEVLEVRFKEKNISDVLNLSVDDAMIFFDTQKEIVNKIKALQDVGLGYIKLGQSSDTLSGGEAQRVKLASFLGRGRATEKILFIFDEPTTGLHFNDIKKLLASFTALINQGHSIIIIEHNTHVIKCADWVIDLGPEAGDGGGTLVYAGVPSGLKKVKESYTGKYL